MNVDMLLKTHADLLSSFEVSNQISAIEDLIAQGGSLSMVIRLLCLATIVNGGIKTKTLESIKREILQVRSARSNSASAGSYSFAYLHILLLDVWLRESPTPVVAFLRIARAYPSEPTTAVRIVPRGF